MFGLWKAKSQMPLVGGHIPSQEEPVPQGIDIAAPTGTPVRAVAAGTVEFTGWSEGYGRIVIISHGEECRTKYGHLSGYAVSSGQKVARGEIIGYVGESGNAIGPHCHFEVEIGAAP